MQVHVQHRGQRDGPLAVGQPGGRALPPQGGDHLGVRSLVGHPGGGGPVIGVAGVADGRDLAQDPEVQRPQGGVGVDDPGHPVVDRRGVAHVLRRQAAGEAHVLHGQGGLDVTALGAGDVEERAHGLLRPVLAVGLAEVHEVAAGQVGGERHRDLVLPLPRVDGQDAVPGGVEPERAQAVVAPLEGLGAELAGVEFPLVEAGDGGQVTEVAARGEPHEPDRRAGLRREVVSVGEAEAHSAVVGDEAGVSLGHRPLDLLESGLGELLRGPVAVVQAERGRAERRGDLLEVDAEQRLRDAQLRRERDDELLRIRFRRHAVDLAPQRRLVDHPVLQRQHAGAERPPLVAGADRVGVRRGVVDGREEPFVGELGERLGAQVAVGAAHGVTGEMSVSGVGVRRRRRRDHLRPGADLRLAERVGITE